MTTETILTVEDVRIATRQALGAWAADKTREQIRALAREWQVQANRLQADAAALQRRVVWLRRLARAAPGGRVYAALEQEGGK